MVVGFTTTYAISDFPIGAYVKLTGLKGKSGLGGKHIFIID
jgi:hypothetical protein